MIKEYDWWFAQHYPISLTNIDIPIPRRQEEFLWEEDEDYEEEDDEDGGDKEGDKDDR